MTDRSIKKIIAGLLAGVLVFSTGCTLPGTNFQTEEIPDSTEGEDITLGYAADNVFSLNYNSNYSLNPYVATNHSNQLICALVYENLVEIDNNFDVIPNVATEWSYNDDASVWTIKIDTTKMFHDGTNVTAKDVAYSLNHVNSAATERYAGRFRYFASATYSADDTVVVYLNLGSTQFIKLLNIPIIKSGTYEDKFPIGSGPYTLELETVEDEAATAEKAAKTHQVPVQLNGYEGYSGYDTLPVKTVYLQEYDDAEGIISAFEDSLVDAVINDPSSYTNLGYAATNEFHSYATTNMHYVAFNQESDIASNSGFRYAMQYAFDRAYLVEMLNDNAVESSIPMYPTCADYPTALAGTLDYDLDTCKRILANAGIQDYDDDGEMEYMNAGQEIDLQFILCSDSSAKAGVANKFAEDMASIGLNVTVRELTWDEYYNAITDYINLTKEEKEDEDFEPIEYDMYYAEVKVRNDFDITEMLKPYDPEEDALTSTTINFTNSTDTGYENYMYNYLASGDQSRAENYEQFCQYVLTSVADFVVIGFEKQQLILHRGATKGADPNMGNPLYNFPNWEIYFNDSDSTES